MPLLVVGPVLLVQPPNSSSAETVGAALNPPEAAGTIGVSANDPDPRAAELPHPPSPPLAVAASVVDLGAWEAFVEDEVSGAAQALEPQTSDPERLDDASGAEVTAGWEGLDVLEDRLKTELDEAGGEVLLGAEAGCDVGAERSNRSPIDEDWVCLAGGDATAADAGGGDVDQAKPPKLLLEACF